MFEVHGCPYGERGFVIFHVEDLETSTWRKLRDGSNARFKVWTSTVVWTSRVRSLRSQLADASVRELPFCPRIVGFGAPSSGTVNTISCCSSLLIHSR